MDGAAGPVSGGMIRARGQHKWALCEFHGPRAVAEPSAGGALGIAARLPMSGAKSIASMCVFMHATHLSYPTVLLTSASETLRIPGGSKLVPVAWLGCMVIQYI